MINSKKEGYNERREWTQREREREAEMNAENGRPVPYAAAEEQSQPSHHRGRRWRSDETLEAAVVAVAAAAAEEIQKNGYANVRTAHLDSKWSAASAIRIGPRSW